MLVKFTYSVLSVSQREDERQQRAQLIQDIRQLETTPLPRFKELDLTETAGHGLLDEMSIVEVSCDAAAVLTPVLLWSELAGSGSRLMRMRPR